MSHVGYIKTTMLDLTCSVFVVVVTATVLSVPHLPRAQLCLNDALI